MKLLTYEIFAATFGLFIIMKNYLVQGSGNYSALGSGVAQCTGHGLHLRRSGVSARLLTNQRGTNLSEAFSPASACSPL